MRSAARAPRNKNRHPPASPRFKTILALAKADVPGYHGPRLGGSKKGYRATSMLQGRRPGGSLLVTQAGSGRDRGVSADLANERAKNAPMQSQHF